MYIGAWQEFKLAKILQIKDRVDKEQSEANKLDELPLNQQKKAYSMNNRFQGNQNKDYFDQASTRTGVSLSQYAANNTSLYPHSLNDSKSLQRAQYRQLQNLSEKDSENLYKFKVEERMIPKKQVPILMPDGRTIYADHKSQRPDKQPIVQDNTKTTKFRGSNSQFARVSQQRSNRQNPKLQQVVQRSDSNDTEATRQNSSGSKVTYLSATQSANQKIAINIQKPTGKQIKNQDPYRQIEQTPSISQQSGSDVQMQQQVFSGIYQGMGQQPIEKQYEKWQRFENFLKFAEKKELKDRLKEFDPPPMSNYIDPGTIDNILNQRRKRPPSGKPPKPKNKEQISEHMERIAKMKELYGIFVKLEEGQRNQPTGSVETQLQDDTNREENQFNIMVPRIPIESQTDQTTAKLPEISPLRHGKPKATPSMVQSNKYNQFVVNDSTNEVQVLEEIQKLQSFKLMSGAKLLDNSIGGRSSNLAGEVDELINWAKALPDDISIVSSPYKDRSIF